MKGTFNDTQCLSSLKNALNDIVNENLKDGFSLIEKYTNTKDLRPEAYQYDKSFIDILFENKIPDLIFSLTGKELTLNHVQVRVSTSESSYMPWHRDSYIRDEDVIGCVPPAHKLIFYPVINKPEPKLTLVKGSHLCTFQNQKSDQFVLPGCSVYDAEIMKISEGYDYVSSSNEFLFFNTGMIHNAIPDQPGSSSIRIIYSFIERFQFENLYASKPGHLLLNNEYENTKAAIEL